MTTYETEGIIANAIRLCCGEGGVITDHMTLDIMNGAPGGVDCPRCGKADILWTRVDGTRTITREDEDGDTTWFNVTLDPNMHAGEFKGRIRAPMDGRALPTTTLGKFREVTRALPDDTYLTAYDPDQGWYKNLDVTAEAVDAMRPEDGQPSLILDITGDTDTRQF